MVTSAPGEASSSPSHVGKSPKLAAGSPQPLTPEKGLIPEDLARRVEVLEVEKRREEQARNYLQLERDRIMEFWEVTKGRLVAAEAALRSASLEEEERQHAHSVAVKVYRDRMRSLLLERADREAALRTEGQAALQQAQAAHDAQQAAAEERWRAELHLSRQRELAAEEAVARTQLACEQQLAAERQQWEGRVAQAQQRYEQQLAQAVAVLEERCAGEVREAQRDAAVQRLKQQQAADLAEAREHYRATVQAQLDLVAALKSDVQGARLREGAAVGEVKALKKQLAAVKAAHSKCEG